MLRSVPVVVVALLVTAGSGPAWSESLGHRGWEVTKVRVPYRDLDLTRADGADLLLRRLSLAAARACGGQPVLGVMMAETARAYRACKAKAVADAVELVQAPLVKQRYAERSGPRPLKVAEARP